MMGSVNSQFWDGRWSHARIALSVPSLLKNV